MATCSTCSGSGQQMYDAGKFMNCSACGGLGFFEGGYDPLAPKKQAYRAKPKQPKAEKNSSGLFGGKKSAASDISYTPSSAVSTKSDEGKFSKIFWALVGVVIGFAFILQRDPNAFSGDFSLATLIPVGVCAVLGAALHKLLNWALFLGIAAAFIYVFATS